MSESMPDRIDVRRYSNGIMMARLPGEGWFGAAIMPTSNAEYVRADALAAAEAALAKMCVEKAKLYAEREALQVEFGQRRICVNCGKTRPAGEPKDALPECQHPDYPGLAACTWDATPQEAWEHWRKIAHDERAEREALRAKVEAMPWIAEGNCECLPRAAVLALLPPPKPEEESN